MPFKVMDRCCDQCLYGKDKIVSDARRKQIISCLEHNDNYFICHKSTIVGEDIACRGDYDARGGGKLGRLAKWLGIVKEVSCNEYEHRCREKGSAILNRSDTLP